MIEVICVKFEDKIDDKDFLVMRKELSAERKERVDRFKKREDAIRTMAGEIMVRMHFQKKRNVSFEDIYFLENNYRKPCIGNQENFHFNVSHSGQWIVIAFHDHEVGVDIEKIKPIDFKIVDNFFSKDEIYCFSQTKKSDQMDHFYDLWVLKESYVKAIGKGFYEDFSNFSVTKIDGHYHCFKDNEKVDEKFTLIQLSDEYKLALCSRNYADYNLTIIPIQKVIDDYKQLKETNV